MPVVNGVESHIQFDMTGKRINCLTVMRMVSLGTRTAWLCLCDCGNELILAGYQLRPRGRHKARESCGCLYKKRRSKSNLNFKLAYKEYRTGAKRRGYEWNLSPEYAKSLFEAACFYCGAEPAIEVSRATGHVFVRNGIDRLDSAKGYTPENCVSCCTDCNYLKGGRNYKEFIEKILQISSHILR